MEYAISTTTETVLAIASSRVDKNVVNVDVELPSASKWIRDPLELFPIFIINTINVSIEWQFEHNE